MGLRVWRVGDWVGVKVSLRMEVLTLPIRNTFPGGGNPQMRLTLPSLRPT